MSFEPENVVEMYDGNQIGVPENVTQNLAPIEVTGTATRAYAVGDYMVFGGLLRKVTQAIAQGGTITVGTNVDSTKVSTELQGIHSDLSELKHQEYVSATATTSETYKAFFMRLMALVDFDKINADSYLQKASGSIFHTYYLSGSSVGFLMTAFSSYGLSGSYGLMSSTNASWLQYDEGANPKFTNLTNSNVSSGDAVEWRIYY